MRRLRTALASSLPGTFASLGEVLHGVQQELQLEAEMVTSAAAAPGTRAIMPVKAPVCLLRGSLRLAPQDEGLR